MWLLLILDAFAHEKFVCILSLLLLSLLLCDCKCGFKMKTLSVLMNSLIFIKFKLHAWLLNFIVEIPTLIKSTSENTALGFAIFAFVLVIIAILAGFGVIYYMHKKLTDMHTQFEMSSAKNVKELKENVEKLGKLVKNISLLKLIAHVKSDNFCRMKWTKMYLIKF